MLSFRNQVYILCWDWATFQVLQQAHVASAGLGVFLMGCACEVWAVCLWGSTGPFARRGWLLGNLWQRPSSLFGVCRHAFPTPAILPATPVHRGSFRAAFREASPSPGGALRWSEGAWGPSRATRGERNHVANAPAFTQPQGTESQAVPLGTGPLSAPSWGVHRAQCPTSPLPSSEAVFPGWCCESVSISPPAATGR